MLATRLRRMDDADLCDVMLARGMAPAGISDFFDLADAFLELGSIQRVLSSLDRESLMLLAVVGTNGQASVDEIARQLEAVGWAMTPEIVSRRGMRAARRLLVDLDAGRYVAYHNVTEQMRRWPMLGLPDLGTLASAERPTVDQAADGEIRAADHLAAERAFAATTAMAELLIELERDPAKELNKGGLAAPDSKRLARVMTIDPDDVGAFLSLAEGAGFVCQQAGSWRITDRGSEFLLHTVETRWLEIAHSWQTGLPEDIRRLLHRVPATRWNENLRDYMRWLYPAGGEWADQWAAASLRAAELFGIVSGHTPSRPGFYLLGGDPDAAKATMAELLPTPVERVYLQHDLSVVAPGPLQPHIDARLRSLANPEGRALASTYRISASTINRAMAAGDTAESILEFLSEVSFTAIPQPLRYLVTESSARFGLLRVGEITGKAQGDVPGPRSYVWSENELLLGTLLVDQALSPLGLHKVAEHRIVSRCEAHTVFWALSEAHYPVAAEDGSHQIIPSQRVRAARATRVDPSAALRQLIQRLRLDEQTQPADAEQAWMARQLAAAIHDRAAIVVNVMLPSGAVSEFHLEPTGVAGGRLRARDPKSAIERTLPLSSIVSLARV